MEGLSSIQTTEAARNFHALKKNADQEILRQFSPEEQATIRERQQVLSSLAYFIGKDFKIPVELNQPGEGWYWNFEKNVIRIDPKDLLEKPMDYLRFVISHEGGHRRISRTDFIPLAQWNEPGFAFMMNAIEDPRDNNFVAESYPKFREQMALAYHEDIDFEAKAKAAAGKKLGYQPRFMQAGFEYIKQWFREATNEAFQLDERLPEDVRTVVAATLTHAQDSWWQYPSRTEADSGEAVITRYAKASYKINRDKIWPSFKKLVEEDLKDQQLAEALKEMQKNAQESGKPELPEPLKDVLTPEEQQELTDALTKAIEEAKKKTKKTKAEDKAADQLAGKPESKPSGTPEEKTTAGQPVAIDLSSLSKELQDKIKEYLDALQSEEKQNLAEQAEATIAAFDKELAQQLQGKLVGNPEQNAEHEKTKKPETPEEKKEEAAPVKPLTAEETKSLKDFKEAVEEAKKKDRTIYDQKRREVLPIIDALENDLRELFTARRANQWKRGFRTGKRIDLKKRIQEKAKKVPATDSRAWQRRELPQEKDYAITLLNDLSGSMRGQKIAEDFKAKIVIAEVLNRLSIKTEILGFNDHIYEYQKFGQPMSNDIRDIMGGMLGEVHTPHAQWNDDGWALRQASQRLAKQPASEKILIVLSDGVPEPSAKHAGSEYDLNVIVSEILEKTNQKVIGLGIGPNTEHVSGYYPSSLANVSVKEMAEKLAALIKEVIANSDTL